MEELIIKSIRYFLENPYSEVYLREFAKKTKMSVFAAKKYLDSFLKEDLIVEERKGNMRYFKANMSNLTFRQLKIALILEKIRKSRLIEEIKEKLPGVSSIVLFGSTARGEDDKNSDIDILIIGNNKSPYISGIGGELDKKVNEHLFSWANWNKQKKDNNAFYMDIITQGIALLGEKPIVYGD